MIETYEGVLGFDSTEPGDCCFWFKTDEDEKSKPKEPEIPPTIVLGED